MLEDASVGAQTPHDSILRTLCLMLCFCFFDICQPNVCVEYLYDNLFTCGLPLLIPILDSWNRRVNHVDRHVAARVVLIPGDGDGGIRDRPVAFAPLYKYFLISSMVQVKSHESREG